MARAGRTPPGCEDLQVQLMREVETSLNDAGTQLCIRDGSITGAEARWFLAECAIVSLLVSIKKCMPDSSIHALAIELAREASSHLENGRGVPLDQVTDTGAVKG